MISTQSVLSLSLWFVLFVTCCLGWPLTSHDLRERDYRNPYYNYPQMVDYVPLQSDSNNNNNWELALPQTYYEHEPEEYYEYDPTDLEALQGLFELYDTQPEDPVWGQIVNAPDLELEEPEDELEELKENQNQEMRQRLEKHVDKSRLLKEDATPPPHHSASGVSSTTSRPKTKTSPIVDEFKNDKKALTNKKVGLDDKRRGQKEVPLLRPPSPPVVHQETQQHHQNTNNNQPEPIISETFSPKNKKLSPYDKLRKYLSIEDALKKEAAEKRRSPSSSSSSHQHQRIQKRSYVADEESLLSMQLKGLKAPKA